jgi:hypothetical protein
MGSQLSGIVLRGQEIDLCFSGIRIDIVGTAIEGINIVFDNEEKVLTEV